jgi:hypothetical protein
MVNAGGEIAGNILVAASALIFIEQGGMLDEFPGMSLVLISCVPYTIMTACTTHGIVA